MIYLFVILGTKDYSSDISDNIRFSNEYKDISKNNIYKYVNENAVLNILNGKSGIFLMAFPSNIWSHYYADYLNEIAIKNDIKEIYYYNFLQNRNLNNKTYDVIINKLKEYLVYNDLGKLDLTSPTIVIVKEGKVIYFDDEIRNIKGGTKPEEYFTDYRKNVIKNSIDVAIKEYLK